MKNHNPEPMQSWVIICNGKFHHFDQAKALQETDSLKLLISTYPYSVAKTYGIHRSKYRSLWPLELLKRGIVLLLKRQPPYCLYSYIFNVFSLPWLIFSGTKFFLLQAGYSLELIKVIKYFRSSCVILLDRGSLHTLEDLSLREKAIEDAGPIMANQRKIRNNSFIKRELQEYLLADYIMVPSDFAARSFYKYGVSSNKVLVNPFPSSPIHCVPSSTPYSSSRNSVLFVGQKSSRKGFHTLLAALVDVNKTFQLDLIAIGSEYDLSLPSHPWFHNIGPMPRKDIVKYYKKCRCLCLPSYAEGLALVLCEASSNGMHIISTPNSGVENLPIPSEKITILQDPSDSIALARLLLMHFKGVPDALLLNSSDYSKQISKETCSFITNTDWISYKCKFVNTVSC